MSNPNPKPRTPNGPQAGASINLRSVVWFLAALLCVLAGFEVLARRVGPGATARTVVEQHRVGLDNGGDDASIVFVGDSSSGAAFDSADIGQALGQEAYTVWLPDGSPTVSAGLLEEFTFGDDLSSADTVVLGVTARMLNQTTAAQRERLLLDMRASLPWRSRTSPSTLTTIEQFFADRSGLVRYRAGLRQPTDWAIGFLNEARLELEPDGQPTFFLDKTIDNIRSGYESGERNALADYNVSETELDLLLALAERLEASGREVWFVLLPTYGPIYDPFFPQPDDNAAAVAEIKAAISATETSLIDLTDLGTDGDLFADGNHLNRAGSGEVTERVASALGR